MEDGHHEITPGPSGSTPPSVQPRPSIVNKLTYKLLETYMTINERFYEARRRQKEARKKEKGDALASSSGHHTSEAKKYDYKVVQGEVWDEGFGRYQIRRLLGRGSFGQVVEAVNLDDNTPVAIKIINSKRQYYEQAKEELRYLKILNKYDNQGLIVKLYHSFEFRNHLCFVFELLSYNLYELLKRSLFEGISLVLVRKFAEQILHGLHFLGLERIGIIHCDLKPENILLRAPGESLVKLIDFGSSCRVGKAKFEYVQSRFYRAPEVLLGMSYDQSIDMWSLACILVEMHTGEPLFNGKNEFDQLGKIVEMLGIPPHELLKIAARTDKYFILNNEGQYELRPSNNGVTYKPPGTRRLQEVLGFGRNGPHGRYANKEGHSMNDYLSFMDFLGSMLVYESSMRIKPKKALSHRFLGSPA